jgi:ATP-dependent Clp protease protease subunit
MGAGTQYMIHNSQGMAMGDRNELRALADLMEKVDGGMLEAYMAKSGKPEAAIRGWMDAETWFTAEQAVDNGFADRVNTGGKKAKASADWKLDAFANAPKPPAANPDPQPEPEPAPTALFASDDHRERQQQRLRLLSLLPA